MWLALMYPKPTKQLFSTAFHNDKDNLKDLNTITVKRRAV